MFEGAGYGASSIADLKELANASTQLFCRSAFEQESWSGGDN